MWRNVLIGTGLAVLVTAPVGAAEFDFSGYIEPEIRYFPENGSEAKQENFNYSVAIEPEFEWLWDRGRHQVVAKPFGRLDFEDPNRTHVDLREFKYLGAFDGFELRIGVDKVFWGVTEAVHVIDIINQTDLIENPDTEEKLGQPMVSIGVPTDFGLFEAYYLPYFRERTFPSRAGRPRSDILVDVDRPMFESEAENWNTDYAVRWSHYFGDWDVGVAHFSGTGRDPIFVPRFLTGAEPVLVPFYPQIDQTSVDVQATIDAWLYKFEGFTRNEFGERYYQASGGIEYTLFQLFETPSDLGIVAEYVYDSRGRALATTPFANDVFAGLRWSANNEQSSTLLFGGLVDMESGATAFALEAETRLGSDYFLTVEGRFFANFPDDDLLATTSDDGFMQLRLQRFF